MRYVCSLVVAVLLLGVACTDPDGSGSKTAGLETEGRRSDPVVDIPMPYRTVWTEGRHGLELTLSAPKAVVGGRSFEIAYEVADDEGAIRGVEIEWGDGKTWGGMPFDLVCTASADAPNPREGASSRNKKMTHAYREAGIYMVTLRAYTGGCFTHWDRKAVSAKIEVVADGEAASNGPSAPRAKIGHAYYTGGDPRILVSDLGGYDDDGFVNRVDIDWGDGSTETLERPLSECEDVQAGWPEGWFSKPAKHAYEADGEYLVKVDVVSVGCDGGSAQTDSTQRILEFPPEQGS